MTASKTLKYVGAVICAIAMVSSLFNGLGLLMRGSILEAEVVGGLLGSLVSIVLFYMAYRALMKSAQREP